MNDLQRESSDIQNHCAVPIHISSMIIQSTLQINLIPKRRQKGREEVFPQDCEKAFEMGVRFVKRQKAVESQKEDHV